MPYHLEPGQAVPAEIKRIVREEIESAACQLSGQGEADRDEAIHEARKNIKKIRGVLRLIQPQLGGLYRAENMRFRDIGRQLSQFRDARAMIETFDELRGEYRGELGRRMLASVRRGLTERKKQAEEHANIGDVLPPMAASLRESAQHVDAWRLTQDGFQAIEPGLDATFDRGRKALRRARKCACAEHFHDWRKRVKEHWYHVRLLESFWSGDMEAYEKSLKELETALGEDHNLVLLEEKGLPGNPRDVDLCVSLIGKYHQKLRADALELGKHIYGEKPRQFTRRMRRLWKAKP